MTSDDLAEFYYLVGGALWHIQYLEDTLVSFLSLKLLHERRCAGTTVTLEEAQAFLSEKRRMTFGPLVESCSSRSVIRAEHQHRFEIFKQERHWLVHRSMVESSDHLYGDSTRRTVFLRIDAIREESIHLKKIVVSDLEAWSAAHGVDTEAAQRQAEAAVRKLKSS